MEQLGYGMDIFVVKQSLAIRRMHAAKHEMVSMADGPVGDERLSKHKPNWPISHGHCRLSLICQYRHLACGPVFNWFCFSYIAEISGLGFLEGSWWALDKAKHGSPSIEFDRWQTPFVVNKQLLAKRKVFAAVNGMIYMPNVSVIGKHISKPKPHWHFSYGVPI